MPDQTPRSPSTDLLVAADFDAESVAGGARTWIVRGRAVGVGL